MSRHSAIAKLTIPSGGSNSQALSAVWGVGPTKIALGSAISVSITGPVALTGACTLQVSPDGVNWSTMQTPAGADVACAAGKTIPVEVVAGIDLRIHSAGVEAADRIFSIVIQEQGAY